MRLIVSGALTDYLGRIFLQQTGPHSLVPVHQWLEAGTLPAVTLARAFRDATSLFVMPVRLTSIFFDGRTREGEIIFNFRCIMRGGDLNIPTGQPPAGFFDCPPLPDALGANFKRQIAVALAHEGGPPVLEEERMGLGARLSRRLKQRVTPPETAAWEVYTRLDLEGRYEPAPQWTIAEIVPSAGVRVDPPQPPWTMARRMLAETQAKDTAGVRLASIELAPDRPAIALVFAPSLSG